MMAGEGLVWFRARARERDEESTFEIEPYLKELRGKLG